MEDVVDAILIAALRDEASGQIFNLGCSDYINLRDLAELVIRINKEGTYQMVPFPAEPKQIDIGDYYGDFSKIHSLLGWEPNTSLEEGVSRTLEYYRQHGYQYWDD